jgi:hypothetical protein
MPSKKMKQILIIILGYLIIMGFSSEPEQKNYIQYHKDFSKVEEFVANEKFIEAESELDTLFGNYEVKFAKDYLIAGQVCLMNGHKNKGIEFIRSAIKMGVKLSCLKSIKLLSDKIVESEWNNLKNEESQLRKEYLKSIDLGLYQEFHKRYQEEQDAKRTVTYKSVVYSNFNRIKEITESIGFPGEDIIGLDNQTLAKSISDCGCGNSKIIVTLLHYDFPISEIGEEKLISAIERGNLHPREFATIYNFEKNKVSVLYSESNKEYDILPKYNFNFPFGETITDIEKVNSDREKFGICRYDIDEKKIEVSRKYGMKLKFDYK